MTENAGEKILLIESQYFAPIDVYKTLIGCDILCLERFEHYQKVSSRNRCNIAGPNGRITLSVPLSKGNNQGAVQRQNSGNDGIYHERGQAAGTSEPILL